MNWGAWILEGGIVFAIIAFQIKYYRNTLLRVNQLSDFFPPDNGGYEKNHYSNNSLFEERELFDSSADNDEFDEDEDENEDSYSSSDKEIIRTPKSVVNRHASFKGLVELINQYLRKNENGVVDFNTIKEMTEREILHHEKEIEHSLPIPLFIGLGGTFLGVIIGIIMLIAGSMISGDIITQVSIMSFLGGVMIAMCGSLCGLYLTTKNTNFHYKAAQIENDKRKNQFYNFVQLEIIPEVGETPNDILTAFLRGLSTFNNDFTGNLKTFRTSLNLVTDNLHKQSEFIDKIEKTGFKNILSNSIGLIERFETASSRFGLVSDYIARVTESFEKISGASRDLERIIEKISSFDQKIGDIKEEYQKSSLLVNEALIFFKDKYSTLNKGVDVIKQHLEGVDDNLDEFLKKQSDKIKESTEKLVAEIAGVYDTMIDKEIVNRLKENNQLIQKFEPVLREVSKIIAEEKHAKEKLTNGLDEVKHHIRSLNRKVPPSPIAQPMKFIKFIGSSNGEE